MGQELRQSSAVTLLIGPFIDETDGKTAETGLTIAQADVRLSKNAGNMAQKNEATSCTHDELGYYGCPVDTTDTNILGRLKLMVHESGALPVWHNYMVINQNDWDSKYSTDKLQVDVTQCAGSTVAAGAIPNAAADAAGGLPISDAGGLDLDALNTAALRLTAVRAAILTDWINGGRLDLLLDLILGDSSELQTDWANGGRLDLILDARASQTTADAIETDTQDLQTQIGTAGAGLTDLGGMSTTMKGQVNDEVVDGLNVDTYAEPGQGAPAATATLAAKIGYLYKAFRNKLTQSATELKIYDDAGSTVDQKAPVSDDGTTYTRGEIGSGP